MQLKNMNLSKGKTKQVVILLLLPTVLFYILMSRKVQDSFNRMFTSVFPLLRNRTTEEQTSFFIQEENYHFTSTSSKPVGQHCSYTYLSPENAKEGRRLLDSITWPETLPLPEPFSLNLTTSAAKSSFSIERRSGGWRVGDELTVRIQLRDFNGNPKKGGGDMISSRLHNRGLGAGVVGQVQDHLNGTFTAVFPLLWNGTADVEVTLHQTSESITVLKRLMEENPERVSFSSDFMSGRVRETTKCNVCPDPNATALCNFTDLNTGEQWFCIKPKTLDCNTRVSHALSGYNTTTSKDEQTLFQRGINLQTYILASEKFTVTILPKTDETKKMRTEPSGYYYMNQWRPLGGTKVRQFNTKSDITACLKGKQLRIFGDSTVRQYYEHITARQPNLLKFDKRSIRLFGPFMALDHTNDIALTFHFHGPPIHSKRVLSSQLRYVADEVDGLLGGSNTVVVIGLWAHFCIFPMEVYYQRLMSIHRALKRLLQRAPETKIVIRSANMRLLNLFTSLINSDWFSLQRDKVLRAVFKDMDVLFVDAWDMVQASHLNHDVHPPQAIIKQMIDMILSYICPEKSD